MKYNFDTGFLRHIPAAVQQRDSTELNPFKAGYAQALEDLVSELKDADGFTLRGMAVPISNLRVKALKL